MGTDPWTDLFNLTGRREHSDFHTCQIFHVPMFKSILVLYMDDKFGYHYCGSFMTRQILTVCIRFKDVVWFLVN